MDPVTFEHYAHVEGPFYHGTKSALKLGDELIPGFGSNFQEGRVSNNIYFTALVDTAAWGAELATALAGSEERGHIYIVEPLGPFEDDPTSPTSDFPVTLPNPTGPGIPASHRRGRGLGGSQPRGASGGCWTIWHSSGSRVWTLSRTRKSASATAGPPGSS